MSMKDSLRHILFAALAVMIIAASCKKEEETETKPSLNGDLSFDLPEYVLKGDPVYVTKKAIYLVEAFIGMSNWTRLAKKNKTNE